MSAADDFHWTIHSTMADIPQADWDRCAGPDQPLLWHRHLHALEVAGIAVPENGFTPRHVVLRDARGAIAGAAPAYLKTHSRGELGVDLGLPMAHDRLCGPYYPKLQVEVPMIPFAGGRLLARPGADRMRVISALAAALWQVAEETGASSVQVSHLADPADAQTLATAGHEVAESNTFLWQAGPDRSFAESLGRMTSRARSEIGRQRRRVGEAGLSYRYLRGAALTPDLAAHFYPLYKDNFDRHGTDTWLNQAYFEEVLRRMPEVIDLGLALDGDRWAGAVFSMIAGRHGYSQYWGLDGEQRGLHFELVMYRGFERAFVAGIDSLDFGATGGHKAERGLASTPVWTAFRFRSPDFAAIARAACRRKTAAAATERAAAIARLPYARPQPDDPPGQRSAP